MSASLIESALDLLDPDTLMTIGVSAQAEADRFAEMPGAEAAKWAGLFSALAASAEVALLQKQTGVAV